MKDCPSKSAMSGHWVIPKMQHLEKYLVNEYGDLISFRRGYPHIMKRQAYRQGYQYYPIQVGKKNMKIKVHRIVATTFLEPVEGKNMVNHKDGDRTNNHVSNLEWCNNSENQTHAFRVLKSRHGGKAKRRVMCIETGEVFESVSDAATKKNTFRSAIRRVIDGEQSVAGGFTWRNA